MAIENNLDSKFLERLILHTSLKDKQFLILISNVFQKEYFDDPHIGSIFAYCSQYISKYGTIPDINSIGYGVEDEKERTKVIEVLDEITGMDYDVSEHYDFILDQTNDYLKEQALKRAILSSVDILESKGEKNRIREEVEAALSKDLKIDLGLNYFQDIGKRLKGILTSAGNRVPSYYPQFDEFINGGFPPYTLSVVVAKIHSGKSLTMCNFAARQVLKGHNVVIMTLEMSENDYAQRFDSIYSMMDINRMYLSKDNVKSLLTKLTELRSREDRGNLYIKQFPTGVASINDFRLYMRELKMRGIKPDIMYVDYINLMRSAVGSSRGDNLYSSVKRISEELRSLSLEFNIPVISVSQLNREGSFVGFEELDFNYIAESYGIPAVADAMFMYGVDEDVMVYESEMQYKVTKNRLGGRIGESGHFYVDRRSLAMFDSTELDVWLSSASQTRDTRELHQKVDRAQPTKRRKKRGE